MLEAKLGLPPKTPDTSSLPPSKGQKPSLPPVPKRKAKLRLGWPGFVDDAGLVRGGVVEHEMHVEVVRRSGFDPVEDGPEPGGAMSRSARAPRKVDRVDVAITI